MRNPFEAAISYLEFTLEGADLQGYIRNMEKTTPTEREKSLKSAIRVLGAAGKLNKYLAECALDYANCPYPMDSVSFKEWAEGDRMLRAFLESLPDPEERKG